MIESFKKWLELDETGTYAGSVATYAMPLFGNFSNAFIAGDAAQQARDCGLGMCGGGLPKKKKRKKRKKNKKHFRN